MNKLYFSIIIQLNMNNQLGNIKIFRIGHILSMMYRIIIS